MTRLASNKKKSEKHTNETKKQAALHHTIEIESV